MPAVLSICGLCNAKAQPQSFAPPTTSVPATSPATPAVQSPPSAAPAPDSDAADSRIPSITDLVSSYRANAFADRCEVSIERTSSGSLLGPARRATAVVRVDGTPANTRMRLELGDLTIATDAMQVLLLSGKDSKGYVALPRRMPLLATLTDIVPPLPFASLHLAFDPDFPARLGDSGPLTWTTETSQAGVVYRSALPHGSIELRASGTPLRINESVVRTIRAGEERVVRVSYTAIPHTDVDFAVDLFGREARRSLADLAWASAPAESPGQARIANITGNTTDYKPWSLAESIASRKALGGSPAATAMLMFVAPVGIDAAVIDTDVSQAMTALRAAATELRRAGVDDPARPRLTIEPIAIYDVANFEREAPRKLDMAWTQASRGLSDGAVLRWSLSHAGTIGKFAKGKSIVIVIVDADMNLLGTVDPTDQVATLSARVLGIVSPAK